MSKNIVHVVGTGTIGEPLISLLARHTHDLGIDEVTFHKRSPLRYERAKIEALIHSGAQLAVDEDKQEKFSELGFSKVLDGREAIERASVVIDCTPVGNKYKAELYELLDGPTRFLAQGSENGFGMPYARGINDDALTNAKRFVQVVSCNTHLASSLLRTFAYNNNSDYDNLVCADFVFNRRANDISQDAGFIPAPSVTPHKDLEFGTHHAADAHRLYQTIGVSPAVFSSAMKLPTQYMHAVRFAIDVKESTNLKEALKKVEESPYLALTHHLSANRVFSFGRDHGEYGRILNHGVVVHDGLAVTQSGHRIVGWAYTPQDGNSLLSSVAATLHALDPELYEQRLQSLQQYVFNEV